MFRHDALLSYALTCALLRSRVLSLESDAIHVLVISNTESNNDDNHNDHFGSRLTSGPREPPER